MIDSPMYWYDGDNICGESPSEILEDIQMEFPLHGLEKITRDQVKIYLDLIPVPEDDEVPGVSMDLDLSVPDDSEFYKMTNNHFIVIWNKEQICKELEQVQNLCELNQVNNHWF
jgi:hypothetical protein